MPYGRPSSTGHGYRRPDYIWSPVLMPCARRRRRKATSAHSRPAARKPGLSEELAVSTLDGIADILFNGNRSKTYIDLASGMLLVAIMSQSMIALVLILTVLICRLSNESIFYAANEIVKDYKEKTKAIRIKRKTSVNPQPTAEAIRKAWEASRKSLAGKLLAGALLSDLEPVVDQSYVRNEDGTIVGRRPGIKGWLFENCPDMLPHYKALMNYKELADKLRKALGIEDPDTLAEVLDFGGEGRELPKSLALKTDFRLMKSNRQNVIENGRKLFKDFGEGKAPWTMAALDAALRERLELVWMRRTRKRSSAA